MKLRISLAEFDYRTRIYLESGEYDAIPPLDSVFIENRLRYLTPDRLALACALLVYDYVAGPMELPKACSPEMSRALEQIFNPRNVRISNIELKPSRRPAGERTARLHLPNEYHQYTDIHSKISRNGPEVEFGISDDQSFGSTIGVRNISLACNLRALAADNPTSIAMGVLGVCVLYAEDFGISKIIVPKDIAEKIWNFKELARAAICADIELVIEQIAPINQLLSDI